MDTLKQIKQFSLIIISLFIVGNHLFVISFPYKNKGEPKQPFIFPQPKLFQFDKNNINNSLAIFPFNLTFQLMEHAENEYFYSKIQQIINLYAEKIFSNKFENQKLRQIEVQNYSNFIPIQLFINSSDMKFPSIETLENYTLAINYSQIQIKSQNYYGFLRAIESFSQLIEYNNDREQFELNFLPIFVNDSPDYQHRGIMIDTARQFYPMKYIKSLLDSMMYTKMNVLHWHFSDDESFSIQLKSFPDIIESSTFSKDEYYSYSDLMEIIHHAFTRGIRIIPEISSPSRMRSLSLNKEYNELFIIKQSQKGVDRCLADISNEKFWKFFEQVILDVSEIFPDEYIHMGGDSLPPELLKLWEENENIRNFMKNQNISNINDLEKNFKKRIKQILKNKKKIIFWSETKDIHQYLDILDSNDTLQFIDNINQNQEINSLKSQIIISPKNSLFLACGVDIDFKLNTDKFFCNNQQYYTYQTFESIQMQAYGNQTIGSEAILFSDTNGPSNLEARVWIRTATLAEQLWNQKASRERKQYIQRLVSQETRFIRRGIGVSPVTPQYCTENLWDCF